MARTHAAAALQVLQPVGSPRRTTLGRPAMPWGGPHAGAGQESGREGAFGTEPVPPQSSGQAAEEAGAGGKVSAGCL